MLACVFSVTSVLFLLKYITTISEQLISENVISPGSSSCVTRVRDSETKCLLLKGVKLQFRKKNKCKIFQMKIQMKCHDKDLIARLRRV